MASVVPLMGFSHYRVMYPRNSSEMRDYLTDIWIITSLEPLLCVPVDIVPLGPDLVKVMAGTQWCAHRAGLESEIQDYKLNKVKSSKQTSDVCSAAPAFVSMVMDFWEDCYRHVSVSCAMGVSISSESKPQALYAHTQGSKIGCGKQIKQLPEYMIKQNIIQRHTNYHHLTTLTSVENVSSKAVFI